MATEHPETLPPQQSTDAPPWPTYRRGGRHYSANIYLVPGIQAPNLVLGDGMIHCCITNKRVPLGPGVGTLFDGSFADTDNASPASAAAMRMGQQTIRQCVLEQLIQETMLIFPRFCGPGV